MTNQVFRTGQEEEFIFKKVGKCFFIICKMMINGWLTAIKPENKAMKNDLEYENAGFYVLKFEEGLPIQYI